MADFDVTAGRLCMGEHGSITGTLSVRVGSRWFPEPEWSDFPVVVLGWWLESSVALLAGEDARFPFMDGPFSIEASRQVPSAEVTVTLMRDCDVIGTEVVALQVIGERTLAAARQVVGTCLERGWSTPDIETLRLAVNRGAA